MKKNFVLIVVTVLTPALLFAQGIGLKAGANFANVTKASSINNDSRTGFHAGVFLAPSSKGLIASRTELIFSRQGYNYKTSTATGNVNLDYILLPQLMGINITRYVQIQVGAQMAFLLNAKVDSSTNSSVPAGSPYGKIMDMYNRFDYGFAGGIEIHPVSGLLIGARMNISLGKLYKDAQSGQMPSYSSIDLKNNVFQLFAGWRFGKQTSSKKKQQDK